MFFTIQDNKIQNLTNVYVSDGTTTYFYEFSDEQKEKIMSGYEVNLELGEEVKIGEKEAKESLKTYLENGYLEVFKNTEISQKIESLELIKEKTEEQEAELKNLNAKLLEEEKAFNERKKATKKSLEEDIKKDFSSYTIVESIEFTSSQESKKVETEKIIQEGVQEIESIFPDWDQRSTAFDVLLYIIEKLVSKGVFNLEDISDIVPLEKIAQIKKMREEIKLRKNNI